MTVRKVVNKYYPHDFDPSKVFKRRKTNKKALKVRMMIPFTVICLYCGSYIYKGTKFNTIKKRIIALEYLGVEIYRFYMNCKICNNVFYFKSNPKNFNYDIEGGIKSTFSAKPASIGKSIQEEKPSINANKLKNIISKKYISNIYINNQMNF
uniref:mRNA splicing factor n=1 Tax=Amorphochlora amoebiformis TaxID=1561963 RepID=A0A0H5BQZ3_9EUKA|nr:mRNA splicing factor [Amorphochlora amoebiformis]